MWEIMHFLRTPKKFLDMCFNCYDLHYGLIDGCNTIVWNLVVLYKICVQAL